MAYDPVLERDMFRPKSRGVVALSDSEDNEDLKSRREQALAMIEAAKQKFDPENYQTLSEQERPQVFRPVAVNMPSQQQTANTAQRMQQMAAQGVRPVGMARGGLTGGFDDEYFWSAPYEEAYQLAQRGMANDLSPGSKNLPDYDINKTKPTIRSQYPENLTSRERDILAKERADEAIMDLKTLGAGVEPTDLLTDEERENVRIARKGKAPYDPYQLEGGSPAGMTYNLADDPTTWTPDFRKAMISKILKDRTAERNKVDPRFQSYVEEPTPEKIAREIDQKAAEIRVSRRQTWASEDAARRAEAAPDKRDFAGDRAETQRGIAALSDMEKGVAAGRDTTEAPLISDLENQKGITALADMEKGVAAGRDAYGAEAPLAVDQEAKPIIGQMGRAGAAGQGISSIRSGEEKAAAPATGGTPATGGAQPSQGGAQPSQGGLGSFKQQGESVDSGPMTLEGIRAERAREREENMNLALIQAGLAIMGGKSSNALANIGEGAQAGIRQFATQEAESKKSMRDVMRDMRQERLTRDEMALRERLSAAQIQATSDLAAAQRASTEGMFKTTEDRLNTAMRMDWNKTQAAQDIAREELKIKQDLANNTISSAEADRQLKDAQFKRQIEFDEWKVKQGLAAPSDTMKLYEAIGGGDLRKGMKIVQEASIMDTKAKAAQDILNPMSGASEPEKAEALRYLSSLIKTGAGGSVDTNNPLLK